jgi:uncharacterized protein (TIGR02611 family)
MFRRVSAPLWRAGIILVGGAVVLIGIVLLPLPGPGTLIIALGLAILSAEFVWARHWLAKMKAGAQRVGDWVRGNERPKQRRTSAQGVRRRKRPIRIRRPT